MTKKILKKETNNFFGQSLKLFRFCLKCRIINNIAKSKQPENNINSSITTTNAATIQQNRFSADFPEKQNRAFKKILESEAARHAFKTMLESQETRYAVKIGLEPDEYKAIYILVKDIVKQILQEIWLDVDYPDMRHISSESRKFTEDNLKTSLVKDFTDVSNQKKPREYSFLPTEIETFKYFSDEFLEYGKNNCVQFTELYRKYKQHFKEHDLENQIIKPKRFFALIRAYLEFSGKHEEANELKRIKTQSIFYKGVSLKDKNTTQILTNEKLKRAFPSSYVSQQKANQ